MGYAKELLIRRQELGARVGETDDAVCDSCFADPYVQEWVRTNADRNDCTFCGRSEPNCAVDIDEVWELISFGLRQEWDHAEEWSSHVAQYTSYDVADSFDPELFANDDLRTAFIDTFSDWAFCERDPYGLSQDRAYAVGWEQFCEHVKHRTRFLFQVEPGTEQKEHWSYDGVSVGALLGAVAESCSASGLIQRIAEGTSIYRARLDLPTVSFSHASELGTAAADDHRHPNRMSPAGIPMFYGAFSAETAIAETFDPAADKATEVIATVGTFVPSRDLRVLDLSQLPDMPSICEEGSAARRADARFLRAFARDISQPVPRDDRVHVEYVPTQIVCEYFRRLYRDDEGVLDGIVFPSARRGGEAAVVLFVEHDACVDAPGSGKDRLELRLTDRHLFGPGLASLVAPAR